MRSYHFCLSLTTLALDLYVNFCLFVSCVSALFLLAASPDVVRRTTPIPMAPIEPWQNSTPLSVQYKLVILEDKQKNIYDPKNEHALKI